MASSNVLNIPVFGRNIVLGELYNGYNDEPIGTYLANPDHLAERAEIVHNTSTCMEVWEASSSEDTIQEFRINAGLSLSFLLGLTGARIEADAEYINRRRSTRESLYVYVRYLSFRETTYLHLVDREARNELKVYRQEATHVVNEVTYGVEGVFQCKLDVSDSEDRDALRTEFKTFVNSRLGTDVGAGGQGDFDRKILSSKRRIHCQVYGNLDIKESSFTTTVKGIEALWKKLPGIAQRSEPRILRAGLLPLLDRHVRPIAARVIDMVRNRIDVLQDLSSRISNLLDHPTVKTMRYFKAMLEMVKNSVSSHESAFRAETGFLIVAVRAGRNKRTEEHIEQRCSNDRIEIENGQSRQYSVEYLAAWLSVKEEEADILQEYLKCAESIGVNSLVHQNCTVLALVVRLYTANNPFLGSYCADTGEHTTLPRYEDSPLSRESDIFVRRKETFKQVMSAIPDHRMRKGKLKFVVEERELAGETSAPGISLLMCEEGACTTVHHDGILIKPVRNLQVKQGTMSTKVKWDSPDMAKRLVTGYKVEWRTAEGSSGSQKMLPRGTKSVRFFRTKWTSFSVTPCCGDMEGITQHVEMKLSQRKALPIQCLGAKSTYEDSLQFQNTRGEAVEGADVHRKDDRIDGSENAGDDPLHSKSNGTDADGVIILCRDAEDDVDIVDGRSEPKDSPLPFYSAQGCGVDGSNVHCTLDNNNFLGDEYVKLGLCAGGKDPCYEKTEDKMVP